MSNQFSDNKKFIEEYDLFGKVFPFHDELQAAIPEALEKHFKDSESLNFLDIGAGYGFTTKLVAEQFPNVHFILNEFDDNLLSQSDEYLKDFSIDKRLGDIEEVIKSIPDGTLDAVYTAWVVHNFPQEKRAIIYKEIARVLKSGGLFVALEKVGNIGEQRVNALAETIRTFLPFLEKYKRPDLYIDWIKHYLRDEESDLVFTDDEQEKYLTENGFTWEYVKHILLEKVIVATKK